MAKVLIKKFGTNEVVDEIKCENKNRAEKVERGVNINLNHDEYYTEIEE